MNTEIFFKKFCEKLKKELFFKHLARPRKKKTDMNSQSQGQEKRNHYLNHYGILFKGF